jgi:hypothetical protein
MAKRRVSIDGARVTTSGVNRTAVVSNVEAEQERIGLFKRGRTGTRVTR